MNRANTKSRSRGRSSKLPDEDQQPAAPAADANTPGTEASPPSADADGVRRIALEVPCAEHYTQLKFRVDLGDISKKAARGARLVQAACERAGLTDSRDKRVESSPAAIHWLLEQVADAHDRAADG